MNLVIGECNEKMEEKGKMYMQGEGGFAGTWDLLQAR